MLAYRTQQRHRNLPAMIRGDQYQEAKREVVENVHYVHVLQTKGILGQLYREITRIWFIWHLWHSSIWIVGWQLLVSFFHQHYIPRVGWHLPAGMEDPPEVILVLLLWLWWGATYGRPPRRLWVRSPTTFRPLM